MSIFSIPEIIIQICKYLDGKELFSICQTNNLLHKMIHNMSYPSIIDLRYLSCHNLYYILNSKTLCKVDMSNTMITDDFIGNISYCDTLILQHCYNLTDRFIDLIPNCHTLDISYCPNITGAFINTKNYWLSLTMTGCFFLNYEYFGDLECQTLDLTRTIIANEFCESYNRHHPFIAALNRCQTIYLTDTTHHPLNDDFMNILADKIIYQKITKNFNCIASLLEPDNGKEFRVPTSFRPPAFITICKNYGGENTIDSAISNVEQYFVDRAAYIQSIFDPKKKTDDVQLDIGMREIPILSLDEMINDKDFAQLDFGDILSPDKMMNYEDFDDRVKKLQRDSYTQSIYSQRMINIDGDFDIQGTNNHDDYFPRLMHNHDDHFPHLMHNRNNNETVDQKIMKLSNYHPRIVKEFINLMTMAHTHVGQHKKLKHGLYFRKQKTHEDDFYRLHKTEEIPFDISEAEKYHSYGGFLGPGYLDNLLVNSNDLGDAHELAYTSAGMQPLCSESTYATFNLFNKEIKSDNHLTIEDKQELFNIIYLVTAHINTNNVIYSNNCMLPYSDYDSAVNINEYMNIMETLEKEIILAMVPRVVPQFTEKVYKNERWDSSNKEYCALIEKRNMFDNKLISSTCFSHFADLDDQ
uniref:F-box domain-containing protein n=1 Tax=viral metagenome TaxID=1070528 RepID=A0A6C0CCF3_9ZZZZ